MQPSGRHGPLGPGRALLAAVAPVLPVTQARAQVSAVRLLGQQLQHLPQALHLARGVVSLIRCVQLLHQGFGLEHGQLTGSAPQPLQVGQQCGEVLVRDLCRKSNALWSGVGTSRRPAEPLPAVPQRCPAQACPCWRSAELRGQTRWGGAPG